MSYRIGKYHFATKEEYEAGVRDYNKLRHLERWKKGTTQVEIAKNYRAQINALNMRFESRIGNDFLRMVELSATGEYNITSFEETIKRQKESRRKTVIRQGILLPLYAFLGGAVMMLALYFYMDYRSSKAIEELQEETVAAASEEEAADGIDVTEQGIAEAAEPNSVEAAKEEILPQLKSLHETNEDLVAWLKIPYTEINYPVMWTEGDNDYYLSHNFAKENDRNGLLVLDKRCEADGNGANNLVHGHNMHTGAMFGTLKNYTLASYWQEHPFVLYTTLYEARKYEIMAVFLSSVYDSDEGDFPYYDYIEITDAQRFDEYVRSVKEEALYDTGVEAAWGDNLLTLSTCDYTKENGRLVIVAREAK